MIVIIAYCAPLTIESALRKNAVQLTITTNLKS